MVNSLIQDTLECAVDFLDAIIESDKYPPDFPPQYVARLREKLDEFLTQVEDGEIKI